MREHFKKVDEDLDNAKEDIEKAQDKLEEMVKEHDSKDELHKLVHDLDED